MKKHDEWQALRQGIVEAIKAAGASGVSPKDLAEAVKMYLPTDPRRRSSVMSGILRGLTYRREVIRATSPDIRYYDPVSFPLWRIAYMKFLDEERELLVCLAKNPSYLDLYRGNFAKMISHMAIIDVKLAQGTDAKAKVSAAMSLFDRLGILPYLWRCYLQGIAIPMPKENLPEPASEGDRDEMEQVAEVSVPGGTLVVFFKPDI